MYKLFRLIKLSKDIVGIIFVLYLTVIALQWTVYKLWDSRSGFYNIASDYVLRNQTDWKKVELGSVYKFKPPLWNLPKDSSNIHMTLERTTVIRQYTRHLWFRWKKSLGNIVMWRSKPPRAGQHIRMKHVMKPHSK